MLGDRDVGCFASVVRADMVKCESHHRVYGNESCIWIIPRRQEEQREIDGWRPGKEDTWVKLKKKK